MYGLAMALNRYLAEGGKLTDDADGAWDRADKKIDDAVDHDPGDISSPTEASRPTTSRGPALRPTSPSASAPPATRSNS